jgi:hypothetical protein
LSEHRWVGFETIVAARKGERNGLPGFTLWPRTDQYERWHAFLEAAEKKVYEAYGIKVSLSLLQSTSENNRPCRVPSEWPPSET